MADETRKRASRIHRPKPPPSIRLNDRDKRTIKAVNDYRLLKQGQIQQLLFPSKNTAQVRLFKLWANGFLKRYFLQVATGYLNSPIIYGIDVKGVDLLSLEYGYTYADLRYSKQNTFSDDFLKHTIGLSEVRLSMKKAAGVNQLVITTWHDEKLLKGYIDRVQVNRQLIPIVPDGYCKLTGQDGYHYHFFIEYDRGTEGLRFSKRKCRATLSIFNQGFAKNDTALTLFEC